MITYPRSDKGFFHLTPNGWRREDHHPFPEDRMETWSYEMECPAEDSKERVFLTRTWMQPGMDSQGRSAFHVLFCEPLQPTIARNVTLQCHV